MIFDILTIFPEYFSSPLSVTIIKRAIEKGLIDVTCWDIRDFTVDKHRVTDDRPFGGGEGMVMKIEPIYRALQHIKSVTDVNPYIILFSPRGIPISQKIIRMLSQKERLALICGRYEGVDERVALNLVDLNLSMGDYILSGGEPAALCLLDAITRLIEGVLGCSSSPINESFSTPLLEHPHYTRPREFMGWEVPDVLTSGDHKEIARWRHEKAVSITKKVRPDLLQRVYIGLVHYPVVNRQGEPVVSAITNLDIHDIARSARTFGVERFFVITPYPDQKELLTTIVSHWQDGAGARANPSRKEAFSLIKDAHSVEEAIAIIEKECGVRPRVFATSARAGDNRIGWDNARKYIFSASDPSPSLILFGTAGGLSEEVFEKVDFILEPIRGIDYYNHLSVRSAVAITLDRIISRRNL